MRENKPDKVEGIVLIPTPSLNYLNERQTVAYKSHRKKLLGGFPAKERIEKYQFV